MKNVPLASSPKPRRRLRAFGLVGASALVLSAVAWGTVGRKVFDRPGEEALARVPKDALSVAVVDLHPSFGQLSALRRFGDLADAVASVMPLDEDTLLSRQMGWVKEIWPVARGSAVAYAVEREGDSTGGVAIVPLKDVDGAQAVLKRHFARVGGGRSSVFCRDGVYATVDGGALVVASSKELLHSVLPEGESKRSIVEQTGFADARARIDRDANAYVIVPGGSYHRLAERSYGVSDEVADAMRAVGWVSFGVAVRNDGFALSGSLPVSAQKYAPLRQLAKAKPLDPKLYGRLPAGAYAAFVASQPIQWVRSVEEAVDPRDSAGTAIHDAERYAERELDMDMEKGQALAGDAVLAVYPSPDTPDAGGDVLAVLDDANGANPADAVARVKRVVEDALRGERGRVVAELSEDGLEGYAMARELRETVEHDLLRGASADMRPYLRGKTIAVATDGGAVLASTSEALLARAVALRHGKGDGLDHDAAYAGAPTLEGAQVSLAVDVARLFRAAGAMVPWERLERESHRIERDAGSPTHPESDSGQGAALDAGFSLARRVVEALGKEGTAACASVKFDESGLAFRGFVPFDAGRAASLIRESRDDMATVRKAAMEATRRSDEGRLAWALSSKLEAYRSAHDDRLLPKGDDEAIFGTVASFSRDDKEDALPSAVDDLRPFAKGAHWRFNPALASRHVGDLPHDAQIPLAWLALDDPKRPAYVIRTDGTVEEPDAERAEELMRLATEKGIDGLIAAQKAEEREAARVAEAQRKATEAQQKAAELTAHMADLSTRLDGMIDRLGYQTITPADLVGFDAESVRILRNSVFARHGYRFAKPELLAFFAGKSYYRPVSGDAGTVEATFSPVERQNLIVLGAKR